MSLHPSPILLLSHKFLPSGPLKILKTNRIRCCLLSGLLLIFLLIFSGCNDLVDKKNHAYIGGEIINPTSRFIILKNEGTIIDTIHLDPRNRFSYRMDTVKAGLYLIQHLPESHNIYLESGDSLLLRVNTLAFDESLHFSGKGAARNNLLTEMHLLDENNADLLLSFYKTNPTEFLQKSDSIGDERKLLLDKLSLKHSFSPEFVTLAEKIIKYEKYDLLERYTYLVNKYYKKYLQFPENFHSYRKKVKFNEETLQCSPTYRRFIDNYLINRSFKWCKKQHTESPDCYSLTDVENIKSRIRMVGDLITLPALRRHFLSKLGSLGVVMANSKQEILGIVALLQELGYSKKGIQDINQLGSVQLTFLPGTTIQDLPLVNRKGDTIPFSKIIQKPTIIFLWSVYNQRHISDHNQIKEFRKKYPEISFVGINLDVGENSGWKQAVQTHDYSKKHEYQLGATNIDQKFFKHYLNKLLFLDASGKVVIGDAFINSPEFESRILEFLNQ